MYLGNRPVKVQIHEENYQRTATVIADEETEVLQIQKSALKPLFENNPQLMSAICEIIEERRTLLAPDEPEEKDRTAEPERGVLFTLKKFFGMS